MSVNNLLDILKNELVPALGCTEPIAIAYAAAVVAKHLQAMPEKLTAQCSPNIVKNVKSVIVPNSGGVKGIDAAAIIGALAGNADNKLQVLSEVTPAQIEAAKVLIAQQICDIQLLQTPTILHIIITGYYNNDVVSVEIKDSHTNVTSIVKNGVSLLSSAEELNVSNDESWKSAFTIKEIIDFAKECDYSTIIDVLDRQIAFNSAIALEGLNHTYGINVGRTSLDVSENNVKTRAKAMAASGSDARMSGCDLPVVINSGSGNQGITVSVPVIEFAKELGSSQDALYRALILSNLVAIYEKQHIGKLSAYCGVVCAASGSAAGITLLKNGSNAQIENSITNTLGTLSGMICDGAKPSCAAKIATCVETAISSHELAMCSRVMLDGDGIVKEDLDKTVAMVGRLARLGMQGTDVEILNIMLDK